MELVSLYRGSTYIFDAEAERLNKVLMSLSEVEKVELVEQEESGQKLIITVDKKISSNSIFSLGMLVAEILKR